MDTAESTPRDTGMTLGPARFHLPRQGVAAVIAGTVVSLGAMSAITGYGAISADEADRAFYGVFSAVLVLVATVSVVGVLTWSRRRSEVVIDPVRGEIRVGREHAVAFAEVRRVDVVEHAYTYRAIDASHDLISTEMSGWAIDIGAGSKLFGEVGLSRARVVKIAEALKARVDAYRARTGEVAAPMPRPDGSFLDLMAEALHEEGAPFEENWLALDGPIAERMRDFHNEPDERTMGRDGEFAAALRKAGFDLGVVERTGARPGNEAP